MNTETLLAKTVAEIVVGRFDAGTAYLRVPELSTPMPIAELVSELSSTQKLRIAIFLDDIELPSNEFPLTTRSVSRVIDWRNDASVDDCILIIGNLERDRASGLADIPTVSLDEVRRKLFLEIAERMKQAQVSQPAMALVRACSDLRVLTNLHACADYCNSLDPVGAGTAAKVREELWRLGLLPDMSDGDIGRRKLLQNHEARVKTSAEWMPALGSV